MNHLQAPAPASKPLSLRQESSDHIPPQISAALRGATSAFSPKSTVVPSGISASSTGARLAAKAAGTKSQARAVDRSPERRNGGTEISPPRGRQLLAGVSVISGTPVPAVASNAGGQLHVPSTQKRSSSMLAARHASAHSRSPKRSPDHSPKEIKSQVDLVDENRLNARLNALSGAVASMAASTTREHKLVEPVQPVQKRILDFEKLPNLTYTNIADDRGRSQEIRDVNIEAFQSRLQSRQHHGRPAGDLDGVQIQTNRAGATPQVPVELPRQLSEESTVTFASTISPVLSPSTASPNVDDVPHYGGRPSLSAQHTRTLPQIKLKHQDDYRNLMTVNALADAMVASSLASSRNASPSKKPSPPVPRRRSRSVTTLYEMRSALSKPQPAKADKLPRPMKHTLRKQAASDDEETELVKRGRRHWMRKHPNKHSEGDRKRWRDKLTERERKRYEGVFAANRGLLIGSGIFEPSPDALSDTTMPGNQVVNVIVRDIWERSHLPREVLREIYDLVSPEGALSLSREQFVVGLWLIDQRLKGRKLPVKVSNSVWASVRHSQGIKIRKQRS